MENKIDSLLDKLSAHLQEMTKTETVIGEEFTLGEYTCKPIIKVGLGFGSASGDGDQPKKGSGQGSGAGAGLGITPVGFLVTKKDEITFISTEKNKGFGAIAEKMPDIMDKVMDFKKKHESDQQAKKEK